jgi:hypothetical protein
MSSDYTAPAYAPCTADQFSALVATGLTESQATAICSTILGNSATSVQGLSDTISSLQYGADSGWLVLCGK